MYKFFLCDDDLEYVQSMYKHIDRIITDCGVNGQIVIATHKPKRILETIQEEKVHKEDCNIYMLDIDLENNINGLEIARRIRIADPFGYIVFITGHMEYSIVAYKHLISACAYLIKPINSDEIERLIKSIMASYNNLKTIISGYDYAPIIVKSGHKIYSFKPDDVSLIEVNERKTVIYVGNSTYSTTLPLKYYESQLEKGNPLVRIHRSYIINKNMICDVNYEDMIITLKGNIRVPVSRDKKSIIKEMFKIKKKKVEYGIIRSNNKNI